MDDGRLTLGPVPTVFRTPISLPLDTPDREQLFSEATTVTHTSWTEKGTGDVSRSAPSVKRLLDLSPAEQQKIFDQFSKFRTMRAAHPRFSEDGQFDYSIWPGPDHYLEKGEYVTLSEADLTSSQAWSTIKYSPFYANMIIVRINPDVWDDLDKYGFEPGLVYRLAEGTMLADPPHLRRFAVISIEEFD